MSKINAAEVVKALDAMSDEWPNTLGLAATLIRTLATRPSPRG